jgi:hypothetical protein
MDGRSTHVRGMGNTSTGGATTQSHSGSGSGMSSSSGTGGSRGGARSATGGSSGSGGGGSANAGGTPGRAGAGAVKGALPDFAKELGHISARLSKLEMGARAKQISFTSLMDGDLRAYNLLGELKMSLGKQNDGKYGVVYHNGVAPPRPTKPLVSARQLYIVVGWDGEFAEDFEKPSDFARVDVHLSTEGPDFIPTGVSSVGSIYAEGNISIPADMQDFYIKLVAVTLADVPSAPSAVEMVRPLPATAIAAESIAAVHLASEISLSSTFIAGDPAGAHVEFNASGLAMFRADQTPTVMFSTEEGNALITGSIQTALASSGKSRIVFNTFPELDWNEIRFFGPGDKEWSSLFASRDREGRDGAIALQGFMTPGEDDFVMMINVGQDHILEGVFRLDETLPNGQNPFTDGLLTSPLQTLVVGSGGPAIVHNYKRPAPDAPAPPNQYDPFFAFMDTTDAMVNGTSVLEINEYITNVGNRRICLRNAGTDTMIDFGVREEYVIGFENYDGSEYIPIVCSAVSEQSGRATKEDIEPLADHISPLAAITAVEPKRYRRKTHIAEDDVMYVPDVHPRNIDTVAAQSTEAAEVLTEARRHRREDGKIPVGVRGGTRAQPPEYGIIAEEVREVAPEAVTEDDQGRLLVNAASLRGLMWGAIRDLALQVSDLERRLIEMSNGAT